MGENQRPLFYPKTSLAEWLGCEGRMVAPGFDAPLTQKMEFYDGKPLSSTTSTSSHILTLTLTLTLTLRKSCVDEVDLTVDPTLESACPPALMDL